MIQHICPIPVNMEILTFPCNVKVFTGVSVLSHSWWVFLGFLQSSFPGKRLCSSLWVTALLGVKKCRSVLIWGHSRVSCFIWVEFGFGRLNWDQGTRSALEGIAVWFCLPLYFLCSPNSQSWVCSSCLIEDPVCLNACKYIHI